MKSDRTETIFVLTLISGLVLALIILLLQLLNFPVSVVAAVSGVSAALTSIRFYEAFVLVLAKRATSLRDLMLWAVLKLAALGTLLLILSSGSSQAAISGVIGMMSLLVGAGLGACLDRARI